MVLAQLERDLKIHISKLRKKGRINRMGKINKKLNYIKKLLNKYKTTGDLKERLILNHIIVLYNCFGPFATEMLFLKLPEYEECLKPFLLYLNFLPEKINDRFTVDIPLDTTIVERLRAI